ncbi:MAG TPA: O-methyltransferase [Candidatus Binataceae bacterium]|nr:O-methyltransferase [Candidatus Binataceae bacterium]
MAADEKFTPLTRELHKYLLDHGHNSDPLLAELAAETHKLGQIAGMQIAAEQGSLMAILARSIGARSAVEVGTFTGYSAICIARALPPDGHLLCCDVNPQWTEIARRYWDRAGLAGKITLKLAPAVETLSALPSNHVLDFTFIDADKVNYRNYYEECLKRTRAGGLILIDNVLWGGSVIDPKNQTDDTKAIRALNDLIAHDQRVDAVMIPVSDGLTVARKK